MEGQILKTEFNKILNQSLRSPNPHKLQDFFSNQIKNYKLVLFFCQNNYFGKFEKNIITTKVKILKIIHNKASQLTNLQIATLGCKLRPMTKPNYKIIKNGIIQICSTILQLKENLSNQNSNIVFRELLEEIFGELVMILRPHIILKEYKKLQNKQENGHQQQFKAHSQKIIQDKKKKKSQSNQQIEDLQLDQDLMAEISKQIQSKSIQEIMKQYLEYEELNITQSFEVCRICLDEFKIDNIRDHVRYCQKKNIYTNMINQIALEKAEIVAKIQKILEDDQNNQHAFQQAGYQNLSFDKAKIYKLLLSLQKVSTVRKKSIRSNSTVGLNLFEKKKNTLESHIDGYHQNNPKDELLSRYAELTTKSQLVRGKIMQLQKILIFHDNETVNSFQEVRCQDSVSKLSSSKKKLPKNTSMNRLATCHYLIDDTKFKSFKIAMIDHQQQNDDSQNHIPNENICKSLENIKNQEDMRGEQVGARFKDFQFLRLLGHGAFGKVYLGRRKKTFDYYAVKVIKIDHNWGPAELKLIENEHQIFKKISSNYLVTAPFSFTQGSCHFFVMEYVPGGDLGKLLQKQTYFDEKVAKFYLAQIIQAVQALHKSGIIHRDLKPQNLVIDEQGHLKLTDFGLSEIRINDKINKAKNSQNLSLRQSSDNCEIVRHKKPIIKKNMKQKIIGTPDYIAPEIISQQCLDNQSIDWWSLGVIAYEMLIGCRPFSAQTVEEVLQNIMANQIEWPEIGYEEDMISPAAVDLINKLLQSNYSQRLGAVSGRQIKEHPFFENINWEALKNIKAPLTVKVQNNENLKNLQENKQLKMQIKCLIKNKEPSQLKLKKFVRYDLLVTETFESAQKNLQTRKQNLNKLKKIATKLHLQFPKQSLAQDPVLQLDNVIVKQQQNDLQQNLRTQM